MKSWGGIVPLKASFYLTSKMPCKSVLATRIEASLVLVAFDDDPAEHAAGPEMYGQLCRFIAQNNPPKTILAAYPHV